MELSIGGSGDLVIRRIAGGGLLQTEATPFLLLA